MMGLLDSAALAQIASKLGSYEVRTTGWVDFRHCPFCGNRKGKFGIDGRTGWSHCFRCQERASLGTLLKRLGLLNLTVRKVPVPLPSLSLARDTFTALDVASWKRLPSAACGESGKALLAYARGRHVDPDIWEVGMLERDTRHLGRLVFLFREYGVPVYYQARAVLLDGFPKSLNPPAGEGYPKGRAFFGHDLWRAGMHLVVSEGPFDGVATTDLTNGRLGTCLMGLPGISPRARCIDTSVVPREWRNNLERLGVERITIFLDRGKERQALLFGGALHKLGYDTSVVLWPRNTPGPAKDPSELGPEGSATALRDWSLHLTDTSLMHALARGFAP